MTRGRRTSRQNRLSPRWALERLEERILLSGNVTATVTNTGNLRVIGLAKGSEIQIQSTSTGALQVSSLDGTTTINGSTSPFTTSAVTGDVDVFMLQTNDVVDIGGSGTVTNVPHNLVVAALGGNDTVAVENATIGGSISIVGFVGSDTFTVGSGDTESLVGVGGSVSIFGGSGNNNTIAVFDANITGNLDIVSSGANDVVEVGYDAGLGIIGEPETAHVNIGGNLDITTPGSSFFSFFESLSFSSSCSFTFGGGQGFGSTQFCLPGFNAFSSFGFGNSLCNDFAFFGGWCGGGGNPNANSGGQSVSVADVSVTGHLSIQTSNGNSQILIGAAPIPSGGSSTLNLVFGAVTVGGNVGVNAGNGNNTVFLDDVSVTGNTGITTGRGNDDIAVLGNDGFFNGTFSITAGAGKDSIAIINGATFLSSVTISAGRGADVMWVAQDLFQGPVTINGGPGNDTLIESEDVYPNSFLPGYPVLHSIENVMLNVSPTDPIITTNFGWLNTLLGV
jgi:hypothetical protein